MLNRIFPMAIAGMALLSFDACKPQNGGIKKTADGLEYQIFKDSSGKNAVIGDVLEMNLQIKIVGGKDSLLMDSRNLYNNKPVPMTCEQPMSKGEWTGGLTLLSAGDSAVFYIPTDSIIAAMSKQGATPPAWMTAGKKLAYCIAVVSVKSQEAMKKELEAQAAAQKQIDDQKLQEYFTANNLKPNKTESGVYYIIDKEGTGAAAQSGQVVTVNYTGKTLEGKTFDSNVDPSFKHTDPLSFTVGAGMVIKGWDEGAHYLKTGSKTRLFIPSPLAYGPQSPGPEIPENGILIFDIAVLSIKDAPQAPVK
jgi:FKBP-type peptidyl-prolyl cis-trans isomerase